MSLYVVTSLLCECCGSVNVSHAHFIIGLRRICSCANEHYVFIFICSLLVGVDSVADKLKRELMLHFVECTQLFSIYSPERWKWHFRPFQFQNFLGDPHKRRANSGALDTVSYSIQTYWLLQLLLKPLICR